MDKRLILLDIETQQDFFLPGGSCYGPDAAAAAGNILRLFQWAKQDEISILSTVLRIRPSEIGPMCKVAHCIEGSRGERKLPGTILPRRINLGLRNTTDLPAKLLGQHQQVIIEKRSSDIFAHARLERLITELQHSVFVLCGAGVATSIAQAAVGLRNRGFSVLLARDAVVDLGDDLSEMALRRMEAKGVVFAPTAEIVAPKPQRRARPLRKPAGEPVEKQSER